MRQIDSLASSVIVWLGETGDNSKEAFALIRDMNFHTHPIDYGSLSTFEDPFYSSSGTQMSHILRFPNSALVAISKLLERSWWNRIWVVQEVVVAVNVVVACGSWIVPWDFIRTVSDSIRKSEFRPDIKASLLRRCDYRKFRTIDLFRFNSSMTLLQLLRSTRNYEATDPRDKIYALLGIACDIHSDALSADYSKSVSTVYQDVVRFMVETQGNLDLIASGRLSITQSGAPTWLPNWQKSNKLLPLVGQEMSKDPYKASGGQ